MSITKLNKSYLEDSLSLPIIHFFLLVVTFVTRDFCDRFSFREKQLLGAEKQDGLLQVWLKSSPCRYVASGLVFANNQYEIFLVEKLSLPVCNLYGELSPKRLTNQFPLF